MHYSLFLDISFLKAKLQDLMQNILKVILLQFCKSWLGSGG